MLELDYYTVEQPSVEDVLFDMLAQLEQDEFETAQLVSDDWVE